MGERLNIQTLGSLSIQEGNQPVEFETRKEAALLAYLALSRRAYPREVLAELLWEDRPQAQSLANLRHVLAQLRQKVGDYVLIASDTVAMNLDSEWWLDAAEFESQLDRAGTQPQTLESALTLYQGDFLAGFFVDSTAFEAWGTRERERLRLRAMEGLDRLITSHLAQGNYAAGIAVATRLLDMDNLREETHRQMMHLLALSGQRGKALEQYDTCRRLLGDELGVEPTPDTTALYERIKAGEPLADTPTGAIRSYIKRERIGTGGFGEVYRAFQAIGDQGREVAIKVIRPELANHPDFIRRFETEAQLVARLEHPHIVPLYDYWREPGGAYLVMRYLPAGLREHLSRGPLSLRDSVRLVEQIAAALAFAHSIGVIHRDLKPANVLMDDHGNAYLTDFGIAKVLHAAVRDTQEGALVGSPAYLSPEQIRSEPVTPASDVYSFGLLLYEILTGQPPFPGDLSPSALLYKQLNESLPTLLSVRPDLPPALDTVIQTATAKNPAARFADALELAAALRRAAQTITDETVRPFTPVPGLDYEDDTLRILPPARNPYKGLKPFMAADTRDFFGREALVEQLVARLADADPLARFLAVVGPSGSGKSSVVRAGLVAALQDGALPGAEDWYFAEMLPGPYPLDQLEIALSRVTSSPISNLREQLERDARGLSRVVQMILPKGGELFLLIDQFEEVFMLAEDPANTRHLLNLIQAAVTDARCPVRVVITLRADFYDRPLMFPAFGDLLRRRTEVVLPMSAEELERAIVRPAAGVNAHVEPALAAALIAEIDEQPGALPMLQYALTELFQRRTDHALTLESYHQLGGVLGVLSQQADATYDALDPHQQAAARQLFLRLVTLGEGTEDTRRRALRAELISVGGATIDSVLDTFDRARLLTFDHDLATRGPTVEVAHEAILREWPLLRTWLDESRADIRQQRLLAAAVQEWRTAGEHRDYLLSGSRLVQFDEWARQTDVALTQDEREFLDTSRTEDQRRRARRRRIRNVALGAAIAVALIMTVLALFALDQEQQAQDARATSDANLAESRELALVNGAQAALAKGDLDTALALALAANQLRPSSARARVVLAEAAYAPGTTRLIPQEGAYVSALSRDGRLLLTAGYVGGGEPDPIHLWDAATGELLRTLNGHNDNIWNAVFSPDSRWILSSGSDGTLRLWDVQSGEELRRFEFPSVPDYVWGLAFNSDGSRVYGTTGPYLVEWAAATGQITRMMLGKEDTYLLTLDLDPDGRRALTTSWDGTWLLWDLTTGEPLHHFGEHGEAHTFWTAGCFLPDGHRAVTSSYDKTIILWDLDTYEAIRHFDVPTEAQPLGVVCSPDSHQALTEYGTVNLWDVETGQEIPLIKGVQVPGTDSRPQFFPDGRHILFGQPDVFRVWDLQYGPELRRFTPPADPGLKIDDLIISGDESFVIAETLYHEGDTSHAGPLIMFDMETGAEIRRFGPDMAEGPLNRIAIVGLSHSGQVAAGVGWNGQIPVWDVSTGQLLWTLVGHTGETWGLAFSPDDRTLVSASEDGTLILWDLATGQAIRRFIGHDDAVMALAISPDGRQLVSGSADATIIVWDLNTGEIIHRLVGHNNMVGGVAISPDGQRLLSSALDGSVMLWDLPTGQLVRAFSELVGGNVNDLAGGNVTFDPGGRYAFAATRDGTFQWDTQMGQLVRRYPPAYRITFSVDGRSFYVVEFIQVSNPTSNGIVASRLVQYRFDSPDELLTWTYSHRYIRELTCLERATYHLEPGCDAAGGYPTSTPYLPPPSPTLFATQAPEAGPTATTTPTVTPRPVLEAQVGENRGEVAAGSYQVWHYAGRAGETLQVSVSADVPCNGATDNNHCLDTLLTVVGPHGEWLSVGWGNGVLMPGANDIEPGVNSDSQISDLALPSDGDYTIQVSGFHFKTGGAYTLTIASTPAAAATPTPETPSGS